MRPSAWWRGMTSVPVRTRGRLRSPNVRSIGWSEAPVGAAETSAAATAKRPTERRKDSNLAQPEAPACWAAEEAVRGWLARPSNAAPLGAVRTDDLHRNRLLCSCNDLQLRGQARIGS